MNRKTCLPYLLLLVFLPLSSLCHAFVIPEEALRLIAGTTSDPCSICAEQNLKKALALLDKALRPGATFTGDDTCGMVKNGPGQEITLTCQPSAALISTLKEDEIPPRVVFTFHTAGNKLVGVSENDYTARELAELFMSVKPGTVFQGRIRLIPYKYGDGSTFNYYKHSNTLQFHCIILELKPAVP